MKAVRDQSPGWCFTCADVGHILALHWFLKFDGVTKKGKKCVLHCAANGDYFDSFAQGRHVCKWLLDEMANDGKVFLLRHEGNKYRPLIQKVRKYGPKGESWHFNMETCLII